MKTNDLRILVQEQLETIPGETYYKVADENAVMPYKVFSFTSVNLGDINRDDIVMDIDLWNRATDPEQIEEMADTIEQLFNAVNLPTDTILPSFFRENRVLSVIGDRHLQHVTLTFTIQNYERNEN